MEYSEISNLQAFLGGQAMAMSMYCICNLNMRRCAGDLASARRASGEVGGRFSEAGLDLDERLEFRF